MVKKTKLYGMIIGIVLFAILILGITYASISWQSSNTNIDAISECFTINYSNGQNINIKDLYVINEEDFLNENEITIVDGMALTTVSIELDSECSSIVGTGKITLNNTTLSDAFKTDVGKSAGSLKYKLVQYSSSMYPSVTTTDLNGVSFTVIASGEVTSLGSNDVYTMDLISGEVNEYIFIFYLDEVLAQNDIENAKYVGNISASAVQKVIE